MKEPLISVVIPIYNKQQHIERCLKSLLSQTYKNLEIICIDDGSSDLSYDICVNYANCDKRIQVFKQANVGAAASRNRGFKLAKGEYLVFLDADDWFDKNMISCAYYKISSANADVAVWGYKEININFEKLRNIDNYDFREIVPKARILEHKEINFDVVEEARTVPWNKMVRKDLLVSKSIQFQCLPSENDVFFSNSVILSAHKIVFIDKSLVHYYCGLQGSISESRVNKKSYALLAYEQVYQFIVKNREYMKIEYLDKILDWIFGNVSKENNEIRIKSISENYRECKVLQEAFRENINNKEIKERNRAMLSLLQNKGISELSGNLYTYLYESINCLLKKSKVNNDKIALWGCGYRGKLFIDAIEENNLFIDYVIDNDASKQGTYYKTYLIQSYEEVKDQVSIILILNNKLLDDISDIVMDKEIIDFSQYYE